MVGTGLLVVLAVLLHDMYILHVCSMTLQTVGAKFPMNLLRVIISISGAKEGSQGMGSSVPRGNGSRFEGCS